MSGVYDSAWPISRLGEALEALAQHQGLPLRAVETPVPPELLEGAQAETLDRWINAASSWLGFESEWVSAPYAEVAELLRTAGPAVVLLPGSTEEGAGSSQRRFLALVGRSGGKVRLLTRERTVRRERLEEVYRAICEPFETPLRHTYDALLAHAGVPPARRDRARRAIFAERLRAARLEGCWLLRLPPSGSFAAAVRHARVPGKVAVLLGAHLAEYLLYLASWWLIGQGALQGRLDPGWLIAWVLMLLTLIPCRLAGTWAQGVVAITVGALLKQRLLAGALRMNPERIRMAGAGQLLGRVIESEAVESLALSAGFTGLMALIELALAVAVLAAGEGGAVQAVLLVGWVAFALALGWRYLGARRAWTETRVGMTNDLVERMVGHRTRLAQEQPERWHDGEDESLARYQGASASLDRSAARLTALIPRGWLILGLCALLPAFVWRETSPAGLAVAFGGMMLAFQALSRLTSGLTQMAGAVVAWRQVAPLFDAAADVEPPAAPAFALPAAPHVPLAASDARHDGTVAPLVDAHELVFRYHERGEPVLRGCSLRIFPGDRLLLEGSSGGGKSTLASLLVGLRQPQSGLLLLDGLDRATLGSEGWRRRVVAAPQFHENHVLSETFAFNLLFGRRWPASPADLEEAAAVCHELGLGSLLQRMPSGLLQMVGETSWQLSHGEKSRLFIARALLQGAELVVLDESFAALDPETLARALRCVLRRAPTLLVIAHT